jgi:DNA-binding NarL/FixJ family response regulator
VTRRLIADYARRPSLRPPSDHFVDLTPREVEVFTLVAHGLSNTELARHLTVSEATVKTHVARIFSKLDLHDRVRAVVLAYETSLIQPGEAPDHRN